MKRLVYSREARRALDRMPRNVGDRICAKLEAYAADPKPFANLVTRLKGTDGLWRMRIGDWRVIFAEEEGTVIAINKIASRGSVYK